HIMGILNVTPDSFSDGGLYSTKEKALEEALKMEADGADIIDVGGESTRPSHDKVSEKEEIERVIPIIEKLSKVLSIPISIDTYKSETARLAIEAGADIINDVWGAKKDPQIAKVAAEYNVTIVLMQNRYNKKYTYLSEIARISIEAGAYIINDVWGAKKDPQIAKVAAEYNVPIVLMHNRNNKNYTNLIEDMISDLNESINIATEAGVMKENIILDPGVGFAKTMADNYEVLK